MFYQQLPSDLTYEQRLILIGALCETIHLVYKSDLSLV